MVYNCFQILDGFDKSGEEIPSEPSDEDDSFLDGEDEEGEYDEEFEGNLFNSLTEEQKAQLEAGGMTMKYPKGAADDFEEEGED